MSEKGQGAVSGAPLKSVGDPDITIARMRSGDLIMGAMAVDEARGVTLIRNARLIIPEPNPKQDPKKDGNILLVPFLGGGDYMTFYDVPVYSAPVENRDLIREYIKATTSLVLPN